jgi:hypothetical protein
MAISPLTRNRIHDMVDGLLDLLDQAAMESACSIGALKIKDAADALCVTPRCIYDLVQSGKLVQVDKLITKESIQKYLGTTPRARARVNRKQISGLRRGMEGKESPE